jgi:class 3 adenylate cyclase
VLRKVQDLLPSPLAAPANVRITRPGMNEVLLPKYSLKLLGRFELSGPEGPVELANKKLAALLAYLACSAPEPQSREKLATLLWGSHFDAQALQNLRQALFRLRRALGHHALMSDGDDVWLAPGVIDCDVARLEALSGDGSRASLAAAADFYQDPLLADVTIAEEAWADWLGAERLRLEGLALDAMIKYAEQALQSGNAESALKAGRRAIAVNALREDAHRLIVQALAATGRKAEALKHYQDLVALLKRELNTEPDAATKSLVAELRATEPPGRSPAISEIAKAKAAAERDDEPSPAVAVRPASSSGNSERRQLAILACNLVDSMALSARLDPEDMRDLITAFHKAIADVVSRFDGFVAQYLGDGVLVYFGYPAAREHDSEQAVRAGLAILDAVGSLKAAFDATVRARVGIATGLVVVGEKLGTGDAGQRVAIGETPDLAARLQAAAAPGDLVIAASTHRVVGRMFDCRALAAIEVQGLPQPVEAWQVRGAAAGVSRFEARRAGALSPFVGRQEEIDLLLRRWDQAKRGEGRVVLLSGEPGIGKSRIAESLLTGLEGEPHARLRYFCSPHHTHSPLYPFITQLERAAGFEPGSDASAKLDRLETLLKSTARNLPRDLALIADLLSVPTDGRYPALAVSPQQKREMTFTAILDQLAAMAARHPVLIVVEDGHWIDPTSQDLLDRLVTRTANLPMLLVATARPEFQPAWAGQPCVTMLPLSRLGHRDSAAIIAGVTGDKALPDAVVEELLSRANGVPLFIEELARALLESGLLHETADSYVLSGPLPPLAVPTTLRDSLVARLDRLGEAKNVALIGAVIGREFSHELIAAVAALAPGDLDAALERLTASGLVSRRGTIPEASYSFKHVLVQDAAYATLLNSRRQQVHASVANVLIQRFPALAEAVPEVVARHFTEAGLAPEAIDYWRRAGRLAFSRWAIGEAIISFEHALHVLEQLPKSRSTLEQTFDVLLQLRTAHVWHADPERAFQRIREAEIIAERLDDEHRQGWACAQTANAELALGRLDEALRSGNRALAIARRLRDLRLRLISTSYVAQAHYYEGEYQPVVALAADNLAALPAEWLYEVFDDALGRRDTPLSVRDRGWLVMSLAELGRYAEAAEPATEAVRIAEATQSPFVIAWAHMSAGALYQRKGDWSRALSHFEQATTMMREGNIVVMLDTMLVYSAWMLAQLGDEKGALSRLREGERLVERLAATGFVGLLRTRYQVLARAAFTLGRIGEARRLGRLAFESLPLQSGRAANLLHLLGDIAAHPDCFDADSSEAHYLAALELAKPRGMRPLVAHCHLGLGKLYRCTGARKQAQEHVAMATTMYREMDMPFWLEQAEVEASS